MDKQWEFDKFHEDSYRNLYFLFWKLNLLKEFMRL